jgi:hypothetical protein
MTLADTIYGGAMRRALDARLFDQPLAEVPGPVTPAELAELPEPAQRYMRFMEVGGRPRERAFYARLNGEFRMKPDQKWMHCDVWQHNSVAPVSRVFHMRIDFAGVVPMLGWDTYINGHGHMRGKVANVIKVADGSGPEFDLGELVTWVNDAFLLAPSMLLGPNTVWSSVDDESFDILFTESDMEVSARAFIDEQGRPVNFTTDDRWCALPDGLVQARWSTPIEGWTRTPDDRPVPTRGSAVWHLDSGDFEYARMRFVTLTADPTGHAPH